MTGNERFRSYLIETLKLLDREAEIGKVTMQPGNTHLLIEFDGVEQLVPAGQVSVVGALFKYSKVKSNEEEINRTVLEKARDMGRNYTPEEFWAYWLNRPLEAEDKPDE